MKKIFNLTLALAMCFGLISCNEDFKDWANPQSNAQGEQIPTISGSLKILATTVDYESADEYINIAEFLGSDQVPEDAHVVFTSLILTGGVVDSVSVPFSTGGNVLQVKKTDLNDAVKEAYKSMSDAPRNITLQLLADVMVGGTSLTAKLETNEVALTYTAEALPSQAKENAYYYFGGYNGWDLNNPTAMEANGDGTFSVILTTGDDEWFKFVPQSAVGGDWSGLLGCATNGSEETNDFLVLNGESMKVAKGGDYKFTIDPVNFTYTVAPYTDMLWYAGDANGWSFSPLAKSNGKYVGYYWIDKADQSSTWGFKFPTANNWDEPQYGAGSGEWDIAAGGGNIDLPGGYESGFYQISVSLDENKFSLLPITALSIIGTVNGSWDTDTDLTWDTDKKAWTCTADLNAGEFKIRANHDWTISWGFDATNSFDALTDADGGNMTIDEDANYTLVFTPNCNGYGTLQILNNDNTLYYAGDANGWSHDPMAKVGDEYVGYYYIDAVDNAATWGFKFDPSPDWSKKQYGAGGGDWQIALDGGNITLPDNKSAFYQIKVNLLNLSYSVSEISAISIIGTVNGNWDTDTDLTYDHAAQAWTCTATLSAGNFKFRANHDWALSWGGASGEMTSQNGDNINLAEGGTYTVTFAPKADGYGVFTISK